jgi:maltose-binding protein MalE
MNITAKRALRALFVAAIAALSAACATVTRGTKEAWTVESEPSGARVTTNLDGVSCAATPCTFKIPRKSEFTVQITKDGYKPVNTQVTNQVANAGAAGMAGNVLVGGVIGIGVDAVSGAMLELKPNPLHVVLEKAE